MIEKLKEEQILDTEIYETYLPASVEFKDEHFNYAIYRMENGEYEVVKNFTGGCSVSKKQTHFDENALFAWLQLVSVQKDTIRYLSKRKLICLNEIIKEVVSN